MTTKITNLHEEITDQNDINQTPEKIKNIFIKTIINFVNKEYSGLLFSKNGGTLLDDEELLNLLHDYKFCYDKHIIPVDNDYKLSENGKKILLAILLRYDIVRELKKMVDNTKDEVNNDKNDKETLKVIYEAFAYGDYYNITEFIKTQPSINGIYFQAQTQSVGYLRPVLNECTFKGETDITPEKTQKISELVKIILQHAGNKKS